MYTNIEVEGIGPIKIKEDNRIKHISIRMSPSNDLWINLPKGCHISKAISFAKENIAWIKEKQHKLELKKQQTISFQDYKTRYHKISLSTWDKKVFQSEIKDKIVYINYPDSINEDNPQFQVFIKKIIVNLLKFEAAYYIPRRVDELAKKHGFKYKSVKVKDVKSIWGSCTAQDALNFNIHLMRIPQELIDMIILHELCHTIEKNHSSRFWALLRRVCPNIDLCRREMKQHSPSIY